ncbi:hypothetical protein B9Z55_024141 [Caenorhabditis nigoni]|uniref:Uncharacterized protein n=1 Tax=Caenorhabditis nigoni TaxID=1611254 RepID=A0A2G5SSY2_9PELO|nr:hypothetical protein B9Z55_024141 [Caenorhabditis nigoni]
MQLLLQQCDYYCNVRETRLTSEDFPLSTSHFKVDHRSIDVDSFSRKEYVITHVNSRFPPSTPNRTDRHRTSDESHLRTPTSVLKRTRIDEDTEIPKKVARALHDTTIPLTLRIRELSGGEDISGLEENDNCLVTLPEDDNTGDSNHFSSLFPEENCNPLCTCRNCMPCLFEYQNYDAFNYSLNDI